MVNLQCLKQIVVSGGQSYPVFVGFASADEIMNYPAASCGVSKRALAVPDVAADILFRGLGS